MERRITIGGVVTAGFLIVLLLLSSIDSFSIDGLVPLFQTHFNLSAGQTATVRTASSTAHTITLGLMWIFGSLFNRRKFYLISAVLWILLSLTSVLLGSESFLAFVVLRSLSASASSVCAVLSIVLMGDLFRDRALGIALAVMLVGEMLLGPIASAIFSSIVVSSGAPWQAGLLPWPILGIIPLFGLLCLLKKDHQHNPQKRANSLSEAVGVLKIKSYVAMAIGNSFVAFHMRVLAFWMPSVLLSAWTVAPGAFMGLSYTSLTALTSFGTLTGTVLGMPIVLWAAQSWHHGSGLCFGTSGYAKAFPIVVGSGLLFSSLMSMADILFLDKNFVVCMTVIFLAGVGASTEVSIGQQMLMMVLPSDSRAGGIALNRLFGGISSIPAAQIIGFLSDIFRVDSTQELDKFHAFQKAMLFGPLFLLAGSICFFLLVFFFEGDCKKAEEENNMNEKGESNENTSLIGSKSRAESLMYTVIRSRAPTVEL